MEEDSIFRELPRLSSDDGLRHAATILADSSYWRTLCPWLHVGDADVRKRFAGSVFAPSADLVDECRDRMEADGYWTIASDDTDEATGASSLPWAVDIAGLAKAVTTLVSRGWPPNFLLVHDEAWLLVHQLRSLVLLTSGNRLSLDFSVFHVVAGTAGWPPHRDRGGETTSAFRRDGTPQYVTTWVALSEATTTNSCLHVVSKRHDPGYGGGADRASMGEYLAAGGTSVGAILGRGGERALQHIRALPCAAGSLVQFSHRLLHWGSASDDGPAAVWRPQPPRVALSFASTDEAFEKPFLTHETSGLPLPPLETRVALVSALAFAYSEQAPSTPKRRELFWAVVSANAAAFDPTFYAMLQQRAGTAK